MSIDAKAAAWLATWKGCCRRWTPNPLRIPALACISDCLLGKFEGKHRIVRLVLERLASAGLFVS